MQIIPLQNETFFQLDYNCTMADILQNCGFELEVMNSERASFSLPVPDADIPGGMNLKKSVFYSKPEESKLRSQLENEDTNAHLQVKNNDILLGRVAYYENQLEYQDLEEYNYTIPHNDIFSHAKRIYELRPQPLSTRVGMGAENHSYRATRVTFYRFYALCDLGWVVGIVIIYRAVTKIADALKAATYTRE